MERERIIEILEAYRPGEDLESNPEVQHALEMASRDPELAEIRRQIQAFDQVFSDKLARIAVPEGLQESILASAKSRQVEAIEEVSSMGKIIKWFYPASFAAAAAIIIMLALSFTFWKQPDAGGPALAGPGAGLMETADALYGTLKPAYRPVRGDDVLSYLRSNGGAVPVGLPGNVAFDESYACDVVEVNGNKVSIICFKAPELNSRMHLFTFKRSAFPDLAVPTAPQIRQKEGSCCATWLDEKEEQIHVLYSDNGEKNLRRILDI